MYVLINLQDFHAADVLQGMVDIIANKELDKLIELNDLDVFASFFAAVIHDFKHPGFNNGFLINSKSPIAIEYNGK